MHIHILGICGTFMGSLAQLAVQKGLKVTGCDLNVYPPMSDQLETVGIELVQGYSADQLELKPDLWVIGNAMSRGNPLVEAILNAGQAYASGPEFLKNEILTDKWVMAVAGTHGKTSTSSMLAWVLEYAGFNPGFLIGGVPANFGISARLGSSDFFVIEADEYDTAFFDKRSKFVHYLPRTLILNNLEFDHADIFDDLAAIERQFHHVIRIVPSNGHIIVNGEDQNLQRVLDMGCWSQVEKFELETISGDQTESNWTISDDNLVSFQSAEQGRLDWSQLGKHNRMNALSVIAAARSVGIEPALAIEALGQFSGVKRRMELIGVTEKCHIYDDFAHHPTAIATTIEGLRRSIGTDERIVAVIEPRSNTMKMGVHHDSLIESAAGADQVYWFQPEQVDWDLADMIADYQYQAAAATIAENATIKATTNTNSQTVVDDVDQLLESLIIEAEQGGHIVIMSNGGFMGIHKKLLACLT